MAARDVMAGPDLLGVAEAPDVAVPDVADGLLAVEVVAATVRACSSRRADRAVRVVDATSVGVETPMAPRASAATGRSMIRMVGDYPGGRRFQADPSRS